MPKPSRFPAGRFKPQSERDLLIVMTTNLEHLESTLQGVQSTNQNVTAAVQVLVEQVDGLQSAVDRLTGQVDAANQQLSGLNAKLGIKILSDLEAKPGVPHINASEISSTPAPPVTLEEKKRLAWLKKLKDWSDGLSLVKKILGTVLVLLPTIGAVIFGVWKLLAMLHPDRVPPPPNPPLGFMGPVAPK